MDRKKCIEKMDRKKLVEKSGFKKLFFSNLSNELNSGGAKKYKKSECTNMLIDVSC